MLGHVLEGVTRVRVDVFGVVGYADGFRTRVFGGNRVALSSIYAVYFRVDGVFHPSDYVIKGAVLEYEDHHGFDGWLGPVLGSGRVLEERGEREKEEEDGWKCWCCFGFSHFCVFSF